MCKGCHRKKGQTTVLGLATNWMKHSRRPALTDLGWDLVLGFHPGCLLHASGYPVLLLSLLSSGGSKKEGGGSGSSSPGSGRTTGRNPEKENNKRTTKIMKSTEKNPRVAHCLFVREADTFSLKRKQNWLNKQELLREPCLLELELLHKDQSDELGLSLGENLVVCYRLPQINCIAWPHQNFKTPDHKRKRCSVKSTTIQHHWKYGLYRAVPASFFPLFLIASRTFL